MTASTTARPDRSANRHTNCPVVERAHLALVGRRGAAVEPRNDLGAPAYRQLEQQLSQLRKYIDDSYMDDSYIDDSYTHDSHIDDSYIDHTEAHDRAGVRYCELLADHLSGLLAVAYASGVPSATSPACSERRGIVRHRSIDS